MDQIFAKTGDVFDVKFGRTSVEGVAHIDVVAHGARIQELTTKIKQQLDELLVLTHGTNYEAIDDLLDGITRNVNLIEIQSLYITTK